MTTYHTKARKLRRPRPPARNYTNVLFDWIIALALVAIIVILLSTPLLTPP